MCCWLEKHGCKDVWKRQEGSWSGGSYCPLQNNCIHFASEAGPQMLFPLVLLSGACHREHCIFGLRVLASDVTSHNSCRTKP